jgi:hypothetical protein
MAQAQKSPISLHMVTGFCTVLMYIVIISPLFRIVPRQTQQNPILQTNDSYCTCQCKILPFKLCFL